MDPHVNEVCDAKWSNVTKTLAANKMKLGWFGRPCSHIMQPDLKSPATVTCPDKKIETGSPYPCNLKNLSDFCTLQSMATVDALISKGVQNFYWDSCVTPVHRNRPIRVVLRHGTLIVGTCVRGG